MSAFVTVVAITLTVGREEALTFKERIMFAQVSKYVYINTETITKVEESRDENMWVVTAGGNVYTVKGIFADSLKSLLNKK